MKRFLYFHAVMIKAKVWAEDEEQARRRVQENLVLNTTRDVTMIVLEPKKGARPHLEEVDPVCGRPM